MEAFLRLLLEVVANTALVSPKLCRASRLPVERDEKESVTRCDRSRCVWTAAIVASAANLGVSDLVGA